TEGARRRVRRYGPRVAERQRLLHHRRAAEEHLDLRDRRAALRLRVVARYGAERDLRRRARIVVVPAFAVRARCLIIYTRRDGRRIRPVVDANVDLAGVDRAALGRRNGEVAGDAGRPFDFLSDGIEERGPRIARVADLCAYAAGLADEI